MDEIITESARRIMSEPAMIDFFIKQEEECQAAFKSLPLDASRENYQTVHYTLLALQRLKNSMIFYIETGRIRAEETENSPGKNDPSI